MAKPSDRDSKLLEVYKRLAQLDEETQEHISKKFYHGKRPWQTRGESASRRRRSKDEVQQQE